MIIATIVCRLSEGGAKQATREDLTHVVKVSAIGKYPFIMLDSHQVDFGKLLVGKSASKTFTLQNSSSVPTTFSVEKVGDDGKDSAIQIDFTEGVLLPGERANLCVTFTPHLATATSFVTYKVTCFAGNSIEFTARGSAKGYDVSLSTTSIHFGEVNLQSSTNRLINVVNCSDLPTTFQFYSDKSNLFSFSQTEGTVKANSS